MSISKVTAITALLCVGSSALDVVPVVAQEAAPTSAPSPEGRSGGRDDWLFSVDLYGWLTAFQGNVTARGQSSRVDVNLADVLRLLFNGKVDFTMDGRLAASKGPWGFHTDVLYTRLSDSGTFVRQVDIPVLNPPSFTIQGSADVVAVYSVGEAALAYDAYTFPRIAANMPELNVEVLGGARYQYIRTKVSLFLSGPSGGQTLEADKSRSWVDPFVGGRVFWKPGSDWSTSLETDFGGFTVSSNFTFNGRAEASYRINRRLVVNAGYRALYTDHATGSGLERFAYDIWVHGPFFGAGLTF